MGEISRALGQPRVAGYPASFSSEEGVYTIDLDTPAGSTYIEGKLSGRKGRGLVITSINVPSSLWRKGIGSSLVRSLKTYTGATKIYAYNVRTWGPAEEFFEAMNIREVFGSRYEDSK